MASAIRPLPITVGATPQTTFPPPPVLSGTALPITTASSGGGVSAKKQTLFQQVFGTDLTSAMFVVAGILIILVGLVLLITLMAKGTTGEAASAIGQTAKSVRGG